MSAATIEHIRSIEVAPLGDGRFAVTDPKRSEETLTVRIGKDMDVSCSCDESRRYHFRCSHIAAVLTNVSQILTLPEQVESPDPLDVTQMHEEAVNEYLIRVNKALNLLTVRKTEAMEHFNKTLELWKRARAERKTHKEMKADVETQHETQRIELERELEKDAAQSALNILKIKSEELNGARITAMSIKKSLRP